MRLLGDYPVGRRASVTGRPSVVVGSTVAHVRLTLSTVNTGLGPQLDSGLVILFGKVDSGLG